MYNWYKLNEHLICFFFISKPNFDPCFRYDILEFCFEVVATSQFSVHFPLLNVTETTLENILIGEEGALRD
jgi:hypothetical protein